MENARIKKYRTIGVILLIMGIINLGTIPSFAIKNKKEINKEDIINLNFWQKYNDDNLNYFILRAIESNYDLKIAEKNVQVYKDLIGIQKANEFPTIGAGFSPSYTKLPNTTGSDWGFSLPLYASWEADIFLKNRDKILSARKDYEMSLIDKEGLYISVASMTGALYFNILKLNKAIEIQEEIVKLRKEIFYLMSLQNNEGIISYQDVIAANKSLIKGEQELIDFKKEREKLINALAVIIGERPDNTNNFSYSDLETLEYRGNIPKSISSEAIVYRPDYKKAEKRVEKSGIEIKIAKKEFLPSINISGLAFFNAKEFGHLLTTKNALTSLSGLVLGELFSGGRKMSNLKIKKSQYEIALQNYEKTNLTAIQELNNAMSAINYDRSKYEEAKKQNTLEIKDYNLRELKFQNGVISKLDLIQSRENLLSTKLLLLFNKAECLNDYISLYKVLGAKTDNL